MTFTGSSASLVHRSTSEIKSTGDVIRRLVEAAGRPSRSAATREGALSTVLVCCPGSVHRRGDRNPSLSVSAMPDGSTRVHCFAGCESDEVLAAVGLTWRAIRSLRPVPRVARSSVGTTAGLRPTVADAIGRLPTLQAITAQDAARRFVDDRGWNHLLVAELGGRVVAIAGRPCLVFAGGHGGRAVDGREPKVIVPAGTRRHLWSVDRGERPSVLVVVEGLSDLIASAHLSWGGPTRLV
jgi:hypothetical protein